MDGINADLYALLGVSRAANATEIKSAYHKLAKKHHPDVAGSDAASADKFKQINHAYDVLSDNASRKTYDMTHPFAGGGGSRGSYDTSAAFRRAYSGGGTTQPTGFGYKRVRVDEAFDFEEWNRMHFGPTAEQQRRATDESIRRAKETGFVGANAHTAKDTYNFSGYNNRGVNWAARQAAKQRVHEWEVGETESHVYRKFATDYRKAHRFSPAQMFGYVAIAAGVFTVAHLIARDNAR